MDEDLKVAPRRGAEAGGGADQDRRRAARPRHRRRGARHRHHDGPHRRAAGRDRPSRRRGAGRHVPRHSAVVRLRRSRSPAALEQRVADEAYYCICIKAGLLAVYKGNPPAIAVEFARRVLPHDVRPSFNETEQFCRAATTAQPRKRRRHERQAGSEAPARHHRQEERPRQARPPRRRVEGGLRRLRHRDDGVLPGDVDRRPEQADEGGRRRLLPRSRACSSAAPAAPPASCRARRTGITAPSADPRRQRRRAWPSEVLEQAAQRMREAIEQLPDFSKIKDRVDIEVTERRAAHRAHRHRRRGLLRGRPRRAARRDRSSCSRSSPRELGKIPNKIALEGPHRQPAVRRPTPAYTNWELSADRANAARRAMQDSGLAADQVDTVRGYADRRPRIADDPLDARNRRISIVVHNS